MSAVTDLGRKRADTGEINKSVRALKDGCRAEQVAASLAVYCGLPLSREPRCYSITINIGALPDVMVSPPAMFTTNMHDAPRSLAAAVAHDQLVNPRDHRGEPSRWARILGRLR